MSEKVRISVTIDAENKRWIDNNHQKRSTFINELVTAARRNGCQNEAVVRQYRIQQLQSDKQRRKAELESIQEELEQLRSLEQEKEAKQEELIEEAREQLYGARLEPDNPAVQNWAEKIGITPQELIEELE